MTRTERLLRLARERGDLATLAILEGRRSDHVAECFVVGANPFMRCDTCIDTMPFYEAPSADRFVDSGHGLFVNVGR